MCFAPKTATGAAGTANPPMTCAESCYHGAIFLSVITFIAVSIIAALVASGAISGAGHLGVIPATVISTAAGVLAINIIVSRILRYCQGDRG